MKKLWVSIKRGLIRDPKHRKAMGECVWLYEYMLDVVDWETGVISDWKDEAAADDMEMPVRTLREQRRKLAEAGYISVDQKQHSLDILIKNWNNPREYSGQVYNARQGDSQGDNSASQGDTQDYAQGSTQDVTPTSNSKNQTSRDIHLPGIEASILAGRPTTDEDMAVSRGSDPATTAFETALGVNPWPWGSPALGKLARFLKKEYEANPNAFGRLSEWLEGEGKFVCSAPKIRRFPEEFMDTIWPLYVKWAAPKKSEYEVL